MINSCVFGNKSLVFCEEMNDPQSNIFTVLVGRNGTGKSRILRGIVDNFVEVEEPRTYRSEVYTPSSSEYLRVEGKYPEGIIACSNSPFDRFPIARINSVQAYYKYLGLRGLNTSNLGLGFMGRIMSALVLSASIDANTCKTIASVLEYLGYGPSIRISFRLDFSLKVLREALVERHPVQYIREFLSRRSFRGKYRWMPDFFDVSEELNDRVLSGLKFIENRIERSKYSITIDYSGVSDDFGGEVSPDISVLIEEGYLRLLDVSLVKYSGETIRLNDASSGEQSVVISMLGIASHIKNNTLVCIDEPEVCLHPEWQERYIQLLISSFSKFRGCHFIIATHSPQVVSNLNDGNAFVVRVEERETIRADILNHRSADFQLATTFGSPGFKNEYLTRELLSSLSEISIGAKLSDDRISFMQRLLLLQERINPTDPVWELMNILRRALEVSQL